MLVNKELGGAYREIGATNSLCTLGRENRYPSKENFMVLSKTMKQGHYYGEGTRYTTPAAEVYNYTGSSKTTEFRAPVRATRARRSIDREF